MFVFLTRGYEGFADVANQRIGNVDVNFFHMRKTEGNSLLAISTACGICRDSAAIGGLKKLFPTTSAVPSLYREGIYLSKSMRASTTKAKKCSALDDIKPLQSRAGTAFSPGSDSQLDIIDARDPT